MAVAIDRFVCVCYPHEVTVMEKYSPFAVVGLVVFSFAFNVLRFLEFETVYEDVVSQRTGERAKTHY